MELRHDMSGIRWIFPHGGLLPCVRISGESGRGGFRQGQLRKPGMVSEVEGVPAEEGRSRPPDPAGDRLSATESEADRGTEKTPHLGPEVFPKQPGAHGLCPTLSERPSRG